MTNFTRELKRDLQSFQIEDFCLCAAFSAFLSTSARQTGSELEIVSASERMVEIFSDICARLGVDLELKEASRDPKTMRDRLVFSIDGRIANIHYLSPPVPEEDGVSEEEALVYLRCAFLGGGSCTLPKSGRKTGYHLEFLFFREQTAARFCELLDSFTLLARTITRGDKYIVYLSSREAISDFLSVVGARSALKKFENVSEEREESNRLNRVSNCYMGNADKTAIASAEHIVKLKELQVRGLTEALSEPLKEAALARIEYPALSLTELADKIGVSKSCLNHRMRKLMKIHADTVNQ